MNLSVSPGIWTRVDVSFSYDDNHYTTGTTWRWNKAERNITHVNLSYVFDLSNFPPISILRSDSQQIYLFNRHTHTHTHTHIYIYTYIRLNTADVWVKVAEKVPHSSPSAFGHFVGHVQVVLGYLVPRALFIFINKPSNNPLPSHSKWLQ